MSDYRSPCGCVINVAQWTAKRKLVSVKYCAFHKGAEAIAKELQEIMTVYHEQCASKSGLGTPGGLEHMGDVWSKFLEWEELLRVTTPQAQEVKEGSDD